jgi:hypothetical protein
MFTVEVTFRRAPSALSEAEREFWRRRTPVPVRLFDLERLGVTSAFAVRGFLLPGESIRKLLECAMRASYWQRWGVPWTTHCGGQQARTSGRRYLDGCSSAAIENGMRQFGGPFRAEWSEKEKHLTGLFSPGTGLAQLWQRELCIRWTRNVKSAFQRGFRHAASPKIVTAVWGLAQPNRSGRPEDPTCVLFDSCSFGRKREKPVGTLH